MNIFIMLAIILFFAKVGGFISKKLGQSSAVGEILVGMLLGPGVLGIFQPSNFFQAFSNIGIALLMFLMGLEFDIKAFEKFIKGGILIAIFGAFIPFFSGVILATAVFGWSTITSFIFATILMATSISITVTVLDDLKKLRTPLAYTIIDAAVVDNVLGVGMLTIVMGLIAMKAPSMMSFGVLGIEIILFFAAILLLGPMVSRFVLRFGRHLDLRVKEGHLSMILMILFVLTFLAHFVGLSIIIGAFLTGVVFDKTHIKKIEHEIYSMTYGLFIPVFFVFVGSYLMPLFILEHWYVVLIVLVVALVGKFLGSFLGASISGQSLRNSITIGVGMMARCEVAIIIAIMAKNLDIFSSEIYTIVVSSIILTVVITPIILRFIVKKLHG